MDAEARGKVPCLQGCPSGEKSLFLPPPPDQNPLANNSTSPAPSPFLLDLVPGFKTLHVFTSKKALAMRDANYRFIARDYLTF